MYKPAKIQGQQREKKNTKIVNTMHRSYSTKFNVFAIIQWLLAECAYSQTIPCSVTCENGGTCNGSDCDCTGTGHTGLHRLFHFLQKMQANVVLTDDG